MDDGSTPPTWRSVGITDGMQHVVNPSLHLICLKFVATRLRVDHRLQGRVAPLKVTLVFSIKERHTVRRYHRLGETPYWDCMAQTRSLA